MTDSPQNLPSLRESFRPERDRLSRELSLSTPPSQIVTAGRHALDRVASDMGDNPQLKPQIRKTALWLLEIVKSNTGLFDQGRDTRIDWQERPETTEGRWANILFFGGAAVMMAAAFLFKNGGALYGLGALAALRLCDPKIRQSMAQKLPFIKARPLAIEDLRTRYQISAHIEADPQAFLSHIDDSLAAADHILARLSLGDDPDDWHDNPQLLGAFQNLLEAQISGDSDYALKLIDKEIRSVLAASGIEVIDYSKDAVQMFDKLPSLDNSLGLGDAAEQMAAPALVKDGRILRRGTIWTSGHE